MHPPAPPVVSLARLRKRYRTAVALDGVDLSLQPGEIHGLIGPDGAGKSTLLKIVAGVLTFDAGEVRVFDTSISTDKAAESVKDRLGFMPQGLGLNLYPNLTVEENIDFFGRMRLLANQDLSRRKERLLGMTRLTRFRDRPMKHLSGGMKQKLGLICTLIHEPLLLILDEPTTGVDPVSRRDFWEILAELLTGGRTSALASTAYLDEASRFDRITLMFRGKALAQGEPDAIRAGSRGTVVSIDVRDQQRAVAALKPRLPQVQVLGPTIRAFVPDATAPDAIALIAEALGTADLAGARSSEPDLEDVFVSLLLPLEAAEVPGGSGTPEILYEPRARSSPGEPPNLPAIEARHLKKSFRGFTAVDDVSFIVPSGTIFGLLGANGAGKTTVIRMLTGIAAPTAGTGRVAGVDMTSAPHAIKERIGYVSQSFSLYTELTVIENIELYAGLYGLDRQSTRERLAWVMKVAGLIGYPDERAESLPMGLRQRLALGCALVHAPRVLFLDEPTAGVDVLGRRKLWDILFHLSRDAGVAILVTTHYMSEAEHCDQLALMHAGRIAASGTPAQMKRSVEQSVGRVLEIDASDARLGAGILRAQAFKDAALYGSHIHVFSRSPAADALRAAELLRGAGLEFRGAHEREVTMEDVFVSRVMALERSEHPTADLRAASSGAP